MTTTTKERPTAVFDHLSPLGERLLTEQEAGAMLGISPGTLRRYRSTGEPHQPPYVHIGRAVRYRLSELTAYIGALPASGGVR